MDDFKMISAHGAFIFGAVFFLSLALVGDKFTAVFALIGLGSAYLCQVGAVFSDDNEFAGKASFIMWLASVLAGVTAFIGYLFA